MEKNLNENEFVSHSTRKMSGMGFFSFSKPQKQGWLIKQGGRVKNWKKRWFILQDKRLYYFKSPNDPDPQGFIPLECCKVRIIDAKSSKNHCLEIYNPFQPFSKNHPSFFITSDSEEELLKWKTELDHYNRTDNSPPLIEKQGYLVKRGGIVKNWKKRWFVLRGNILYYYSAPDQKEPLGFIPLERSSVQAVPEAKFKKLFCFEITDPSNAFNKWHKSYFLIAESKSDMNDWMDALVNVKYRQSEIDDLSSLVYEPNANTLQGPSNTASQKKIEIPIPISKMVQYLDDNGFVVEDIFNLENIPSNQITSLLQEIEEKDNIEKILQKTQSKFLVARVLFEYLWNNLPESVLTKPISEEFLQLNGQDKQTQLSKIRNLINLKLPHSNFMLLQYLLAFIGRVNDRSEELQENQEKKESYFSKIFIPLLFSEFSSSSNRPPLESFLQNIKTPFQSSSPNAKALELLELMLEEFDYLFMR